MSFDVEALTKINLIEIISRKSALTLAIHRLTE